uniref:EAL domain-containing protein n=1 Tax=Pelagibius sp. Alg239-R121 TaxID=2993448 RepID=UPI0024A6CDE3
ITEGIAMEGGADTLNTLYELKKLGVRLSIDHFGTGYSSLNRLKNFPVDNLKIDRSFVRGIMVDAHDAAICSAVISLGHNMNINVVAEGVESEEQLKFLAERNCDEAQGFLLSRPIDADKLNDLLHLKILSPLTVDSRKAG